MTQRKRYYEGVLWTTFTAPGSSIFKWTYDPNEPRDSHGRWTTGGGDDSKEPSKAALAKKVASAIKERGGITISLKGEEPSSGFAVAGFKNGEIEAQTVIKGYASQKDVSSFMSRNANLLSQSGNYVGGWHDGSNTYLDVSEVSSSESHALDSRYTRDEIAVYDIGAGKELFTMTDHARPSESKGERWYPSIAASLVNKDWHFDPDEPRDDKGRWTTGGDSDDKPKPRITGTKGKTQHFQIPNVGSASYRINGTEAYIDTTLAGNSDRPEDQNKGNGNKLYAALADHLQSEGVTTTSHDFIDPRALHLRFKYFGTPETLDGEKLSEDEVWHQFKENDGAWSGVFRFNAKKNLNKVLRLVRMLAKASSDDLSSFAQYIDSTLSDADTKVAEALLAALADSGAHIKAKLTDAMFEELTEGTVDEQKAAIATLVGDSFAGASTNMVAALVPVIDDVLNYYKEANISIDFDQANQGAINYLQDRVDNVFSTLSDNKAQQVYDAIAQAKAEEHKLSDIVDAVQSVYSSGMPVYSKDGTLIRVDSNDTWATTTRRTEGTRAAASAQKASLESIDMTSWQWLAESNCCDDCDDNDEQVESIGDDFPSGDSQPPAHPNCRCVVTPVISELLAGGAIDDDSE